MQSCLSCSRQILKRNAKSACCTGVTASSVSLAGISWKKVKPVEAPFNVHWTSQFKIMSLTRDDLMAIDMGKLKNKETTMLPKIWERDASRGVLKRDSRSLLERYWISWISTRTWSNWRSLYPDGRTCTETNSPITWRKQSTFDTKRIGGSLSIILEKPDQWEIVLTSTMQWPH